MNTALCKSRLRPNLVNSPSEDDQWIPTLFPALVVVLHSHQPLPHEHQPTNTQGTWDYP